MRLIIFGGTGFIGGAVARRAAAGGAEVFAVSRRPPARPLPATHLRADVADPQAVREAMARAVPTHVMFSLSNSSPRLEARLSDGERWMELGAVRNVLEALRPSQHLAYISSAGTIYGESPTPATELTPPRPKSVYGEVKLACERAIQDHPATASRAAILRLSNPYGPGQDPFGVQGLAPILAARLLRGLSCEVQAGSLRDYVYIADAVEAVWLAICGGVDEVLNIAAGRSFSGLEVGRLICAATGAPEHLLEPSRPADNEVAAVLVDAARARERLGWSPETDLPQGLRLTVDYVRRRLAEGEPGGG